MAERFGAYELIERIAVGGMAEVFAARSADVALQGRPVVIKRMLAELSTNSEHVAMFLDEGKLGALLKHPCIVDVLDIGQVGGSWFMALEHVDGPDLGQVLRSAREAVEPLPVPLAAYVIARAAEGLHFAHTVRDPKSGQPLQLVHRDVSPNNILVGRDGVVKVADFGVAKHGQQLHRTTGGHLMGKVAYMSPEQVAAEDVDARADVFALGVCLWEALTHVRLYSGLSDPEVMRRVYSETAPAPSSLNPHIDAALDSIVMRAVARRRKDRWSSAGELAVALDSWVGEQASKAALAAWLSARYVPRDVGADIATGWSFRSFHSALSSRGDTTAVDIKEAIIDAAGVDVDAPTQKQDALKPIVKMRAVSQLARELVLYVEDEIENWEVAALRLKRNYELLHAADDRAASEILRERGRELSAILMDIQLKGSQLDGIALVKVIRGAMPVANLPPYARGVPTLSIPIFFVTAYTTRYLESDLLAAGADKLVSKPVDFPQLTLALTSYRLRRAARPRL